MKMLPLLIEQLIGQARSGDEKAREEALNSLICYVTPTINNRIRRWRDAATRQDLCQSVLEKMIKALTQGKFRGDCDLKTWARKITENTENDWHDKKSNNNEYPVSDPTNEGLAEPDANERGDQTVQVLVESAAELRIEALAGTSGPELNVMAGEICKEFVRYVENNSRHSVYGEPDEHERKVLAAFAHLKLFYPEETRKDYLALGYTPAQYRRYRESWQKFREQENP